MADIGGSQNDAFSAGINHLTNAERGNDNSITLNDTTSMADQTSQRWTATTPHSVLRSAGAGADDGTFERLQRDAGGYAPGSMEQMQDQLTSGSDDNTA